jgi:hypothetical protein
MLFSLQKNSFFKRNAIILWNNIVQSHLMWAVLQIWYYSSIQTLGTELSLLITMAAGRQLSITKIFITENKRPAPLLLVTKFSESFGTVWNYIFRTFLQGL